MNFCFCKHKHSAIQWRFIVVSHLLKIEWKWFRTILSVGLRISRKCSIVIVVVGYCCQRPTETIFCFFCSYCKVSLYTKQMLLLSNWLRQPYLPLIGFRQLRLYRWGCIKARTPSHTHTHTSRSQSLAFSFTFSLLSCFRSTLSALYCSVWLWVSPPFHFSNYRFGNTHMHTNTHEVSEIERERGIHSNGNAEQRGSEKLLKYVQHSWSDTWLLVVRWYLQTISIITITILIDIWSFHSSNSSTSCIIPL